MHVVIDPSFHDVMHANGGGKHNYTNVIYMYVYIYIYIILHAYASNLSQIIYIHNNSLTCNS